MFCSRCGTQNNNTNNFCSTCGNPLHNPSANQSASNQSGMANNSGVYNKASPHQGAINPPPYQPTPNQLPNSNNPNKKRKKKFKIRYVFLALLLLIIGVLIFNWGKTLYYKYQRAQKEEFLKPTPVEKIYKSFNSGSIDADTFVMQLAYTLFDVDKLDDEYKSSKRNEAYVAPHVLDEMVRYFDEISDSTKEYIALQYLLTDIDFGTDASNNTASNNKLGTQKAYAASVSVTTLNKALLSSDGNFIIWYTDTGNSMISDLTAEQLANRLVNSVNGTKREFGYDFKYEVINDFARRFIKRKMRSVLSANNIDTGYLDTTLPIYVYFSGNPNYTNALAYYRSGVDSFATEVITKIASHLEETGELRTVPSFPYMLVKPDKIDDIDNMSLIAAHELFHHYQPYICGNGSFKESRADLFTVETTANLVAASIIDVTSDDTILHKHLAGYMRNTGVAVDSPNIDNYGYNSFTFAKVFCDVVPNGKSIVMDSLNVKGGVYLDSPLDYMNEMAGHKMMEVMETLAEKNLTNDYKHGAMRAKYRPEAITKMGSIECIRHSSVDRMAINYYYFDMNDYKAETEIFIYTSDHEKEMVRYASVLIFGLKDVYQLLDKVSLAEDIVLNTNDYSHYNEIVIAVVGDNDTYTDKDGYLYVGNEYTIQVARKELIEVMQETAPSRDNECIEFDYNGLLDSLITLYTIYGQVVDEAGKALDRDTSEFLAQLEKDKAAVEEARSAPIKSISICLINADLVKDDSQLHTDVRKYLHPFRLKFIDNHDGDSRTSVHISVNLRGDTRYAILSTSPTNKQLILISIQRKDEI